MSVLKTLRFEFEWAADRVVAAYDTDDSREQFVAALAAVEQLREAAGQRVAYGHNDTCDTELSPGTGYDCTCGHDELAAALARFEGDSQPEGER